MTGDRHPRTGFLWQVVFIAAPVVILSAVALYSLRRDRASIDQDARDRARTLVSDLADQWRESVRKDLVAFLTDWQQAIYVPAARAWPETAEMRQPQVDGQTGPMSGRTLAGLARDALPQIRCRIAGGRIVQPVEYAPSPEPPAWVRELTPEQSQALQTVEDAIFRRRDPAAARQAVRNLRPLLPEGALADAELEILILQGEKESTARLAEMLVSLARAHPDSLSASGTPLADLALIRALRSVPPGPLADGLRQLLFQRVIQHPSFLTPELLAAARRAPVDGQAMRVLEDVWQAQERARTFLQLVQKVPTDPARRVTAIWLEARNESVLALRTTDDFNRDYAVTLVPGRILEQAFLNAWNETRKRIPANVSAAVEAGGRRWPVGPGGLSSANSISDQNRLASASTGLSAMPDLEPIGNPSLWYLAPPESIELAFTLSLHLDRPELLYASYRQRLWIAAGLILAAAAAAGIGLLNAWRAFQRQFRLAEMTSNFVSSVSHELRAPLASVRLMAESLDQGRVDDGEKRKAYSRLIVQECRRLSSLIENVLDFSRIRRGRRSYRFEETDGFALVRETIRVMEPVATERQVSIELGGQPDPTAESQPAWDGPAVQQAVVNLVDNAIKHSPAGSAIQVAYEVSRERIVRITVEDNGPGIPAAEKERIFDPFYRLGSELRRETRGVGIGLSIVRHVAEGHGGRVFVEDIPGNGSRFVLELPLAPQMRG